MKPIDKLIGRQIRCNRQRLVVKKGNDFSDVIFIGDVHWGSPQCDKERFKRMLDYCLKTETQVFLMGD